MFSQTVQVIGLILDFIGAILFVIPIIRTKKAIEKESGTYVGHNPHLMKSKTRETYMGIVGLILLAIGFFLQIVAVLM